MFIGGGVANDFAEICWLCITELALVSPIIIVNSFRVGCAAWLVFSHKHKKRTCRVPVNTKNVHLLFIYSNTHARCGFGEGWNVPSFWNRDGRLGSGWLTDFLTSLCSIDQRAQCAPSCVMRARLVGESNAACYYLFWWLMEGGRSQLIWEKSANLAPLSSLKALNNEARQRNKGAHGDGKSLLLERAQNKQKHKRWKNEAGWIILKCIFVFVVVEWNIHGGGPLSWWFTPLMQNQRRALLYIHRGKNILRNAS